MKVCLLNDSFPPVIDGVVNVMMNYADHLMQDHGAEVIVGTPAYPGADYAQYAYPVVAYHSFDTASVTNGYRTGNPFDGKEVAELMRFEPDIIHSHCPASATIIGRLLREQTGAPLVFTYHTKYDIDIRRAVKLQPVAEESIRAMVGNIEACDDVWVVSRGAGESLRALGFEGRYRVMGNGVDFARGRVDAETVAQVTAGYDLPAGVPVFLFVGRLIDYKNISMILQALKILKDGGADFRMVLIGKGPDEDKFRAEARELGLLTEDGENKCIFTGPIYDRDVLRAWNTRADLFLFPSTFDTNGLVVREAAACGLASVLIRDSCAAEGVTDGRNGFIIEENAGDMARCLAEVCGDMDHLHAVGQCAMDEIYMSWQDCVNEAYDRYSFLLAEKKVGVFPKKKKQPTDLLVSLTARTMGEQDRIRQLGREWFHDFRETATGMMENVESAADELRTGVEEFREELRDLHDEAVEGMRTGMEDLKKSLENMY